MSLNGWLSALPLRIPHDPRDWIEIPSRLSRSHIKRANSAGRRRNPNIVGNCGPHDYDVINHHGWRGDLKFSWPHQFDSYIENDLTVVTEVRTRLAGLCIDGNQPTVVRPHQNS